MFLWRRFEKIDIVYINVSKIENKLFVCVFLFYYFIVIYKFFD